MKCSDLEELLSAYADGELPRTQRDFIEEHLNSCADCRATLIDFSSAGRLISSLATIPQTIDYSQATILKIKKYEVAPPIGFQIRLRPLLAIVAAFFILSLFLVVQPWDFSTPAVTAASIVLDSREVKAFFNGEEIEEVTTATRVIGIEGDVLVVLVRTQTGTAAAEVDLNKKMVTDIVRIYVPELTGMDEQKALEIAKNDPGVQEVLDRGGVISSVSLNFTVNSYKTTNQDGQADRDLQVEVIGEAVILSDEQRWLAVIDVAHEKVISFSSFSNAAEIVHRDQQVFAFLNPLLLLFGILIITSLSLKNRIAGTTAGVTSIVLGFLTLYGGIFAWPAGQTNQLLALAAAVPGMIIGIMAEQTAGKKRWIPVTGIVISTSALIWNSVNIINSPESPTGVLMAIILFLIAVISLIIFSRIRNPIK